MRKYDLDYYYKKIEQIRKIRPNIAISTDVIVGFPQESDDLFKKTLKTCEELKFSKIHVFPFSLRSGTKAEELDQQVDAQTKKQRAKKLLELSKKLEIEYMNKFINQEVEVLIERQKDGFSYGHTSNFLAVKINKTLKHNTFYKTKITKVEYPYCIGE